jgi:hypothetical protein
MMMEVQTEKEYPLISHLMQKYFPVYMEYFDFWVLQKAQEVMVLDYNFVVAYSVITEHVVVEFVVEYH